MDCKREGKKCGITEQIGISGTPVNRCQQLFNRYATRIEPKSQFVHPGLIASFTEPVGFPLENTVLNGCVFQPVEIGVILERQTKIFAARILSFS